MGVDAQRWQLLAMSLFAIVLLLLISIALFAYGIFLRGLK
jgi:hypothetical protein